MFCANACQQKVLVRFASCPSRSRFWFDTYNLIDVCAILPFCTFLALDPDKLISGGSLTETPQFLAFCSVMRPPIRLLKMARNFSGFRILMRSLAFSAEALPVALFLLILLVVSSGSLLYLVEPGEKFANVPLACWFSVITVSTVGYALTHS